MSTTRSTVVIAASLDRLPANGEELAGMAGAAHRLHVRADLIGDLDVAWLRSHFRGELVYTLRSRAAGGADDGAGERRNRLRRAAAEYDFVTLEPGDLVPSLLARIPESKRIVAASFGAVDAATLLDALRHLSATPARLYELTSAARHPGDELAAPAMLRAAGRRDVTAWATGLSGIWTRIVAPWLGAPVVYGRAGELDDAAEGLLTVARLVETYGFPDLPPVEQLFGMVGSPILHSLSPRIHNAAFRALGRPALYLPFHVGEERFGDFWTNVVDSGATDALGLPLRALSVVSPHKAVAVRATTERSAIVQRADSTNFVHRNGTGWIAETTDADGVLLTLRQRGVPCRNRRVAVIGCGGSGRSMAAALQSAGADVTLVNRGLDRGSLAVRLLNLPFTPLRGFSPKPFSIVINATPVGREEEELPFALDDLRRDAVVLDLVYRDRPTQLVMRTRGPGRVTIDGWDMLVTQAMRQFELMTGSEMPDGLARQTLGFEEAAAAEC
jgi:3-dehydroquinate dehydratase/shikimate dehydrogenase